VGHPPDQDRAPVEAVGQWSNADRSADRVVDHQAPTARRIWLAPRAVAMHVTLLIVLPAFGGLFWWQIQRVRQGNTLSWAYVFEWPFFAAYAVYMWWRLVHDQATPAGAPTVRPATGGGGMAAVDGQAVDSTAVSGTPPRTEVATGSPVGGVAGREPVAGAAASAAGGVDDEMAAYNRYLAELDASGRRKRW
jgi:hypothetical protein